MSPLQIGAAVIVLAVLAPPIVNRIRLETALAGAPAFLEPAIKRYSNAPSPGNWSLKVERTDYDNTTSYAKILVTAHDDFAGANGLRLISVQCTMYNQSGKPIAVGNAVIPDVLPGQTGTSDALIFIPKDEQTGTKTSKCTGTAVGGV